MLMKARKRVIQPNPPNPHPHPHPHTNPHPHHHPHFMGVAFNSSLKSDITVFPLY